VNYISSIQNPIIKNLLLLQKKSRERKKQKSFVVEGKREIKRALMAGYTFKFILFVKDHHNSFKKFGKQISSFVSVSSDLFNKITIRSGSEKFIGVGNSKTHNLDDLKTNNNGIYLIAESLEKPGNIGALLRTSAALDISAFILTNQKSDIYHPNVIRSSLGGVFSIPVFISDSEAVIKYLKKNKIQIISTALNKESRLYNKILYKKPFAIIVGNESNGLSENWISNSSEIIKIPMKNNIDSLNVSVAAALILNQSTHS
tara:strand:- start:16920 stop:17696 length:777 start_codon:yes stop_codon:yes gene_type:complete